MPERMLVSVNTRTYDIKKKKNNQKTSIPSVSHISLAAHTHRSFPFENRGLRKREDEGKTQEKKMRFFVENCATCKREKIREKMEWEGKTWVEFSFERVQQVIAQIVLFREEKKLNVRENPFCIVSLRLVRCHPRSSQRIFFLFTLT